jgi:nitrogen fixation protein
VFKGQGIESASDQYSMVRRILKNEALTAFNNAAASSDEESVDNLKLIFKKVAAAVFPLRAYVIQKQAMRRFMRKPRDMRIRDYVDRLMEINNYLVYFPTKDGEEPAVSLPEEDMMDIFYFGIPNDWQRKMVELGFDTLAHKPNEFVELCERISYGETTDKGQNAKTKQNAGTKGAIWQPSSSSKNSKNKSNNKTEKFCPLHKKYGHDANDCKVIQAQIKRMSAAWEAGGATNLKQQKKEFKTEKTEQMFSFMVNAFKKASEQNINETNGKKRKYNENYEFDEDLFDQFNLEENNNENKQSNMNE